MKKDNGSSDNASRLKFPVEQSDLRGKIEAVEAVLKKSPELEKGDEERTMR